MLAKWIWRFGNEEGSLWRRLLCDKYLVEPRSLVWEWEGRTQASLFIKSVSGLWKERSISAGILLECLKVLEGKGSRIKFWKDLKVDGVPLAVVFPRIYALAVNKTGMVSEFGKWRASVWEWHVTIRRPVLGWEKIVWSSFLAELDKFRMRKSSPNSLL
ncbi:hypothetical protein Dsin_012229 [Dipteronia sinensis]|uniref:Reverse transcriptase zinc-binding domain-containing protein n=1 Tax=Dipteronia sinensis TaxID=43782 RepID=A0AAE0E7Z5_9ROSI|nr:hypothetical protein Dsin_012229 [Dipteronia sinensis]